jgi:hypothetical protein
MVMASCASTIYPTASSRTLADVPSVRLIQENLRDEDAVRKAADGCAVLFHQGAMRSVPRSISQLNVGGGWEPISINRIPEILADLNEAKPEPVHTSSRG